MMPPHRGGMEVAMKIIIIRSPKFLSPILARIFGVKRK